MSAPVSQIDPRYATAHDFLPLLGTDHLELYVGNAKQAAHYYQTAFGFQPLAYAGPETGQRSFASYALRQGKITLVLSTPLDTDDAYARAMAEHHSRHGDGVKVYALTVDDARHAFAEATARGAQAAFGPMVCRDAHGEAVLSGIHTYGDTLHVFVERKNYSGPFLPNYEAWNPAYRPEPVGLEVVDHAVGNVELGQMNRWVDFYAQVLGFKQLVSFDDKDISTEYSALMSKVMSNGNEWIKFPINEPAEGKKKSQIQEYLDFYHGPGVQHLALATSDIIRTVGELRRRGVEFLFTPDAYYDTVLDRVGQIDEDLAVLRDLRILIDRDDDGYLLQIFTKPVQDRPTLFFEIIQRKGARSFGKGNFKALFEAIELEQGRRGNL